MNDLSVEERLELLVGDFEAPATTTARRAIERRSQVLRRRRHVGVAAAAGVTGVVVAVVVALALGHDSPPPDEPTVDIDPVQPPVEDGLPALTLDLDGWEVTSATEEHDVPVGVFGLPADVEVPEEVLAHADDPEAVQVFHPPDELMPSIYVSHTPVKGTIGPQMFDTPVTIRGVEGLAWTEGEEVALTWNPNGGNTTVWLRARGLDFDEVVGFANGLEPRDADIAAPPGPDDRFGFEASVPLAGMEEDPLAAERPSSFDRRTVTLSDGTNLVRITVDDEGQRAFYGYLTGVIADTWSTVTVLHRPATLFTRSVGYVPGGPLSIDQGGMAELNWLHTTTAKVKVEVSTDDEDQIDAIVGGIRQLSGAEWNDLLASAPPTTTTTAFVPP